MTRGIWIGLFILLVILLWSITSDERGVKEGFLTEQETLALQSRLAPLANSINPQTNPAVPIGISSQRGIEIQKITQAALNVPSSGLVSTPMQTTSIRVDDENSYLGLIKFCEERGKQPNPFSDPKFKANCGMCVSEGSLIRTDGEKGMKAFKGATGVLVYEKDKEKALAEQRTNNYRFPHVIPSLNAATCLGSSTGDDATPVLAITENDYRKFKKRHDCLAKGVIGGECGICQTNKKVTWVDPRGGLQPLQLVLFGKGVAQVEVRNGVRGKVILSETTPSLISLGNLAETTPIRISVTMPPLPPLADGTPIIQTETPYLYGALTKASSAKGKYELSIHYFMDVDSASGTSPNRGEQKQFAGINSLLPKLIPSRGKDKIILEGRIPLTFVDSDQLAMYDCPVDPLMTNEDSASLLIDDPCLRPRGQKAGSYSNGCLEKAVRQGGCTASGRFLDDPSQVQQGDTTTTLRAIAGQRDTGQLVSFFREQRRLSDEEMDVDAAMNCVGKDIRTPCDKGLQDPNWVPDAKCLAYLYNNESSTSKRIGSAYGTGTQVASQRGKVFTFCRAAGTMNPDVKTNPSGATKAIGIYQKIAQEGYKGKVGIEAVKLKLQDMHNKATGNLDKNISDSSGGAGTSWTECINEKIVPLEGFQNSAEDIGRSNQVFVLQSGSISPQIPNTLQFSTMNIRQKNNIGEFTMPLNYTCSFKIVPKTAGQRMDIGGTWANILRFGRTAMDSNGNLIVPNCCTHGDRALAIWFFPDSPKLHIRISDFRDGNWGVDTGFLDTTKEIRVTIRCEGRRVIVDAGPFHYETIQPSGDVGRYTGPVMVWMSDPYHVPANANIKDFHFAAI